MSENFPTEIWEKIFLFACTDGGRTGCSIALVSRYFYAAVLPVQLHSVALTSTRKTNKFAALLEKRPPQHRKVHHLYITRVDTRSERQRQAQPYRYFDAMQKKDYKALKRVMLIVSSELITLTSTLPYNMYDLQKAFPATCPSLIELTVRGCEGGMLPGVSILDAMQNRLAPLNIINNTHNADEDSEGEDAGQENEDEEEEQLESPRFPALKYLHVFRAVNTCLLYLIHAPVITHLRLSVMAHVHTSLRDGLIAFSRGKSTEDTMLFPSTLEKIYIEPYSHRGGRTLFQGGMQFPLGPCCRAIAEADVHHKLVLVNGGCLAEDRDKLYDARKDWEDRIRGGRGCWVEEDARWRSLRVEASSRHLTPGEQMSMLQKVMKHTYTHL